MIFDNYFNWAYSGPKFIKSLLTCISILSFFKFERINYFKTNI